MKLICAGLPKTGTTSMANALRILGYKVYDFPEHFDLHFDEWFAMYRGEKTPDFVAMYESVDAVTDLPPAFWYEELLQAFPDARVILTVRDSDEVWMQSVVNHRRQLQDQIRLFSLASLATLLSAKVRKVRNLVRMEAVAAYGAANAIASLYKKKYKEHNERVQAVIPKEKLLVFNVKQGWDPLCEFLGVDVPSQEFPHANVASSVTLDYMARVYRESMWETIIYVILPVVGKNQSSTRKTSQEKQRLDKRKEGKKEAAGKGSETRLQVHGTKEKIHVLIVMRAMYLSIHDKLRPELRTREIIAYLVPISALYRAVLSPLKYS